MNSLRVLDGLVFGGGTMLRLCHGLRRYLIGLDFWMLKETDGRLLLDKLRDCFEVYCDITDANLKRNTVLFEIRSANSPRRLKIEIRRGDSNGDYQDAIAFSKYSLRQVVLKAHTLECTMIKKVAAALDRKEIRDFFDIEFIFRRDVELPSDNADLERLRKLVETFKTKDFKVTLGSCLDPEGRAYYSSNGFALLKSHIDLKLGTLPT